MPCFYRDRPAGEPRGVDIISVLPGKSDFNVIKLQDILGGGGNDSINISNIALANDLNVYGDDKGGRLSGDDTIKIENILFNDGEDRSNNIITKNINISGGQENDSIIFSLNLKKDKKILSSPCQLS